jgi:high-affinity iron transporter
MLIFAWVMLSVVLLAMVGEQVQEMQLAHWLPTTKIEWLGLPDWVGLLFAVFSTLETLFAQVLAAVLVVGSYFAAKMRARGQRISESLEAHT